MNTTTQATPRAKITRADWLCDVFVYAGVREAKAYRTAWEMACELRAPHRLRRNLRQMMRHAADDALTMLRRRKQLQAARTAA